MHRLSAWFAAAALVSSSTAIAISPESAVAAPTFVPLTPARLLDTRAGEATVDGQFAGVGIRPGGTTTPVSVVGRGGVPLDAAAVVLNLATTDAAAPGFITVYPCGQPQPLSSSLNFAAGQTISNAVTARVGAAGQICVFNSAVTDIVIDVTGAFPDGAGYLPLMPARLLDTRPGQPTIDGQGAGKGPLAAKSTTALRVAGRAGVPNDASSVVINLAVTEAAAPGYITIFPCGGDKPLASSMNFDAGQTISNAVTSKIGAGGQICVFTYAASHVIIDVAGAYPAVTSYVPFTPGRFLDTRSGSPTVDGQFTGIGSRASGSLTELVVAGRGNVATDASAVTLNVAVAAARGPGFVTVFPCGQARPLAASLNFTTGQTISNGVTAKVGTNRSICIFTYAATDVIVDVTGAYQSPTSTTTATHTRYTWNTPPGYTPSTMLPNQRNLSLGCVIKYFDADSNFYVTEPCHAASGTVEVAYYNSGDNSGPDGTPPDWTTIHWLTRTMLPVD